MPSDQRLCVQWPRFGPYHLARLEAAQRVLGPRGVEVVGLETASDDALYGWAVEGGPVAFRREQVFPGRTYEAIPPREMERGVAAALDRIRPDAVAITSYSTPDARAALAWCRRTRAVAVMMFDSRAEDAPRVAWREAVKRVLVQAFDAAVVAGGPQAAYAAALGIPPTHLFTPLDVVDNARFAAGAEAARADPARAIPGAGRGPFFLAVARLIPVKNIAGLLRAHARYCARTEAPWPLVVVGDGPERPALEALARKGGGPVSFHGFLQGDALAPYYGLAGALVLPSHKDTWGLVVNEAMAAGLPVLVSEAAGCAHDLVEPGRNGSTFAPADVEGLAALLAGVAALPPDARDRMGRRSREIVARFRPEDFARALGAAVDAGRTRADRPLGLRGALVLGALRRLARDAQAFHSAPA